MDLKQWLIDNGVKADRVDAILPDLAPATSAIELGVTNTRDHAAQLAAIEATRQELAEANNRVNQELIEISAARNAGEPITAQMRTDLGAANARVAQLETILRTRGQEMGLNVEELIPAARAAEPPAGGDRNAPDLSGYAKSEDVRRQMQNSARYLLSVPADLMQIAHEHRELTGEYLDTRAIVAEIERRAGDPKNYDGQGNLIKPADARAIWEETQGIPAKREAKAAATREAELQAARDEGYNRARTEAAIPGQEPVRGNHAPIFRRPTDAEGQASRIASRQGSGGGRLSRVQNAAGHLARHTYADKSQQVH